ncbi:hypothetical protein, partial [Morganella morganii]|uniref:hypothetical protein n=2 Tax=Morganella morganii TaxID=582 RepID=UPI003EBEA88F
ARNGESGMPRNPLTLIIIAIILLTTALLAGCYLYSLPNHCKPLPGNTLDGVICYECEAP